MELKDLYNQIQNPLDDINNIKKIIAAYSNCSHAFSSFYSNLTKTVPKKYKHGEYYPSDADYFYAMLFNMWKNSIVSITKDEFLRLYRNGSYGKDFIKLREYLKKVPNVTTEKEANSYFNKSTGDDELDRAIDKYRWTAMGECTGFVHVCSRHLTAKKDPYPEVEHRLYIDTESVDTYQMAIYFIKKCVQRHIPYYFKFDEYGGRDDTMVIYCSTADLMKYVEILQEIKKEHPNLISRVKEPPVLTGKIDGWIGYGSEPGQTPSGKNQSFNEVRSKALEEALEKCTKNWVFNNQYKQIKYQGKTIDFIDYISILTTDKFFASLEKNYNYMAEDDKKLAEQKNTTYTPSTTIQKIGYSLADLNHPQLRNKVYQKVQQEMPYHLNKICHSSDYENIPNIYIPLHNHSKYITNTDISYVLNQVAIQIANNDHTYIEELQQEIKNSARRYGVDPNKYCFDLAAVSKIQNYVQKTSNQRNQQNPSNQHNYQNTQQVSKSQTQQPKTTFETTIRFNQHESLKRLQELNKKLMGIQKNDQLNDMLNDYSSTKNNSNKTSTNALH